MGSMKTSIGQGCSPACEFSLVLSFLVSLVYIFVVFREICPGLAAAFLLTQSTSSQPRWICQAQSPEPCPGQHYAVAWTGDCVCQPAGLDVKTTPCCPYPAAFVVFCVVRGCPEAQTSALATVLQHFTESHAESKVQLPGPGATEAT